MATAVDGTARRARSVSLDAGVTEARQGAFNNGLSTRDKGLAAVPRRTAGVDGTHLEFGANPVVSPKSAKRSKKSDSQMINPFEKTEKKTDTAAAAVNVGAILKDLEEPRGPRSAPAPAVSDPRESEFQLEMAALKKILRNDPAPVVYANRLHVEIIELLQIAERESRARMAVNHKYYVEKIKALDSHLQRRLNRIREIKEEKEELITENKRLRMASKRKPRCV